MITAATVTNFFDNNSNNGDNNNNNNNIIRRMGLTWRDPRNKTIPVTEDQFQSNFLVAR